MYPQQETNPHFQPHFLQLPDQRPPRRHPRFTPAPPSAAPVQHRPDPRIPPAYGQNAAAPVPHRPDPRTPPAYDTLPPQQQRPAIDPKARSHGKQSVGIPGPGRHVRFEEQQGGVRPQQQQPGGGRQQDNGLLPQQRPSSLREITTKETKPLQWLIAAFCALFWVIVIVAGLAVLIIYLVYRPRLPKFDISTATLNAAYLDMGYLLNADVTILANFSNPNSKVNVDFSYVILDLYYQNNLIATRYIDPFTAFKGESIFQTVHMVTSQVRLPFSHSHDLTAQINEGRVTFVVKGLFRARSKLGGMLKYSYWLNSRCTIIVTGPPTGVLVGKKCTTTR